MHVTFNPKYQILFPEIDTQYSPYKTIRQKMGLSIKLVTSSIKKTRWWNPKLNINSPYVVYLNSSLVFLFKPTH